MAFHQRTASSPSQLLYATSSDQDTLAERRHLVSASLKPIQHFSLLHVSINVCNTKMHACMCGTAISQHMTNFRTRFSHFLNISLSLSHTHINLTTLHVYARLIIVMFNTRINFTASYTRCCRAIFANLMG